MPADNDSEDYFVCPNCGTELPGSADFCRDCGASPDSGWNASRDSDDEFDADEFDYDEFDYDEFVRREFPGYAEPPSGVSGKRLFFGVVVLLLCAALIAIQVLF